MDPYSSVQYLASWCLDPLEISSIPKDWLIPPKEIKEKLKMTEELACQIFQKYPRFLPKQLIEKLFSKQPSPPEESPSIYKKLFLQSIRRNQEELCRIELYETIERMRLQKILADVQRHTYVLTPQASIEKSCATHAPRKRKTTTPPRPDSVRLSKRQSTPSAAAMELPEERASGYYSPLRPVEVEELPTDQTAPFSQLSPLFDSL